MQFRCPFSMKVALSLWRPLALVVFLLVGMEVTAAPSTNVLRNGSFELPLLPPNSYLAYPAVSNWTITGLGWYLFNGPTSPDTGSTAPTDGQQQLWMSKDTTPQETVTTQLGIASILSNTVYTLQVDVNPNPGNRAVLRGITHGEVALVTEDNFFSITTVATTGDWVNWPGGVWSNVVLKFDSALWPQLAGQKLRVYLITDQGSTMFDNARLYYDSERLTAYVPSPADEAEGVNRNTAFSWRKGDHVDAVNGHDLYLSTDSQSVASGDTSAHVGLLSSTNHVPSSLLQAGQTYYWRVDELYQGTRYTGDVWSFTVDDGVAILNDLEPNDTNGVNPNIVLRWTPGLYAATTNGHDVYFGTSYDDVNNGAANVYMGRFSSPQFDPPGSLTPGVTYYWRVDEVNGSEIWRGPVWSFAVFDSSQMPGGYQNGYAVWVADTMQYIFPASRPAALPPPSASISMARREYESIQLIVLPATARYLNSVSVQISDLVKGTSRITTSNIQWHQVGYLPMGSYSSGWQQYLDPGAPSPNTGGWWPDLLLSVNQFDVGTGMAQPIWITVYAPNGTPPGLYTGTATITTDSGLPTVVPLSVQVHDFTLARGPAHCRNTFTLSTYPPWWAPWLPNGQAAEYDKYARCLLQYRMSPDDIYRNATPFPAISNMVAYYEMGMNAFCYTKADSQPLATIIASVNTYLGNLNAQVSPSYVRALRRKAFFYGWDEKDAPWPTMAPYLQAYTTNFPDSANMTTARFYTEPTWAVYNDPVALMDQQYLDWFCAPTSYYDFNKGELIRRGTGGALQMWVYGEAMNVGPPLFRVRETFWNFYHEKADGILQYAVNGWPLYYEPMDPSQGPFFPDFETATGGYQGEQIFPGINGPVPTLRMANIRDGIEDYEYLWMAAQRTGDPEGIRQLCSAVSSRNGTSQTFAYNPVAVRTYRDNLAAILNATGNMLLANPSFEDPPRSPGAVTATNIPLPSWTITGNNTGRRWYPYSPTTGDGMGIPTAGEQYLWIGQGSTRIDTILSQSLGPVRSNTTYTFTVDVMPWQTNASDGTISLAVSKDGTNFTTVAQSANWSKSPKRAWTTFTITFNSAKAAKQVGKTLYAFINNRRASCVVDNARAYTDKKSALYPQPLPNATSVPGDTPLSWVAGDNAVESNGQRLYFSTNQTAVRNGDASALIGTQTVPEYYPAAPLVPGNKYYWRVDSITPTNTVPGNVWCFTARPANLLANGGFELPLRQREFAAQWVTNAPIPSWTVTGSVNNLCFVYRPTVVDGMPLSTEEQQYAYLGRAGDTSALDTLLIQTVGTIQPNTKYTFEADVMPHSFSNSDGQLTLVADDGTTGVTIASGLNWTSQSTGVWWHTSVTFDSATAPQHVGKTLKAQINNRRDAAIVDNAVLSAR